jgi:hypothetical protein
MKITYKANFATCTITGIKSVGALRATPLQAYPNPVENRLNVALNRDVHNAT